MRTMLDVSLQLLIILVLCYHILAAKPKADPNDNRGNTPFFLQDPYDQMCLGPYGFTVCDENALWILTKRPGKKTYSLVSLLKPGTQGLCLQRRTSLMGLYTSDAVAVGPCSTVGSKLWEFEFVDHAHVKLSTKGQCLVRGRKDYKNSASVQSCNKGEFIPLMYHPTAVHENGFFLKSADGECFDGSKFRSCLGSGSSKLLWGIGVKYVWGEAKRYFFNFSAKERSSCIVARGYKVEKGSCSDSGSLDWSLNNGQLAIGNRKCVARRADDSAVLVKCKDAFEFISMEVPTVHTNEQLLDMLKNPNLTSEEKTALTEALQRKGGVKSG